MALLSGRKGIIMGVANDHSIAWLIAQYLHSQGAQLGFSYLPCENGTPRARARVQQLVERVDSRFLVPCDVSRDEDIAALFSRAGETYGTLDFVLHSIAFAPLRDIRRPTVE